MSEDFLNSRYAYQSIVLIGAMFNHSATLAIWKPLSSKEEAKSVSNAAGISLWFDEKTADFEIGGGLQGRQGNGSNSLVELDAMLEEVTVVRGMYGSRSDSRFDSRFDGRCERKNLLGFLALRFSRK